MIKKFKEEWNTDYEGLGGHCQSKLGLDDRVGDIIVYEAWKNLDNNVKGYFYYPSNESEDSKIFVNCTKEAFPDVVISANGKEYVHKKYDAQITLVKGIRREILNQENKVWGAFEFVDLDKFRCLCPNGILEVQVGGYGWTVYSNGKKAATIRFWKPSERARRKKKDYDEERWFQLVIAKELSEECYPLLFAIPVLGF